MNATSLTIACCGALWVVSAGCQSGGSPDSSPPLPANGIFPVQIESGTADGLPACTSSLDGQTAFVSSPPDLYWCNAHQWIPIPCSKALSGDVAYASTSQTLWACVDGTWTQVALPQGPTGPQGPAGPQGPEGGQGPQGPPGNGFDSGLFASAQGAVCTSDDQCATGNCTDGVCCDTQCTGNCSYCAFSGHLGTCTAVPDRQDPRRACQQALGGTSVCGGACYSGQCAFPDIGTWCGLCSACDGNGRCTASPGDDSACGEIVCSGLDNACRVYQDLTSNRCEGLGLCKQWNDPATCTAFTDLHGPGCP
jgi:hypothetical protein